MSLNCKICPVHCCGKAPVGAPVLMPAEVDRFRNDSRLEEGYYRVNRKPDGTCIFLDEQERCTIYPARPTECKLYPYIVQVVDGKVELVLHQACSQKANAGSAPEIPDSVGNAPASFWQNWSSGASVKK